VWRTAVNSWKPLRSAQAAWLLDLDPDIGRGIEEQQWQEARDGTRVTTIHLDPGPWSLPQSVAGSRGIIGLIVIDGVISREEALRESVGLELLCHGDVLLPPTAAADPQGADADVNLTALSPATLSVLGQPFIRAAARWPILLSNLNRRIETQRHRTVIRGLAVHLPRAQDRLLMTLWELADGCGRVTPEGIILPLTLSHDILARLSGARRPTITLAIRALESEDQIRRRQNGHLLLTKAAREQVNQLMGDTNSRPTLGPRIILRGSRPHPDHAEPTAK
jgi:CRP-like cAMP-binding protein